MDNGARAKLTAIIMMIGSRTSILRELMEKFTWCPSFRNANKSSYPGM